MKITNTDINGETIKDTEVYTIQDNCQLDNLVLSKTVLYVGQETRGHSHAGQDEIYFFLVGEATMILGYQSISVVSGDIILVPEGVFHKVINNGDNECEFNCVFEGNRKH